MTRFLTAKHWQLFLLLFGVPIFLQFIVIGIVLSDSDPFRVFSFMPILMLVYTALFLGWFYSLGINLHKKLPVTVRINLTKFKIFILFPALYILFLSFYMSVMFSNLSSGELSLGIAALIVPLHLFSMFCIFYCLYFNAKALKAAEWQRPVTFSDFSGEFFLLWFFPIGVWIIQPRINKLFDPSLAIESAGNDNGDHLFW